jgi:MSHA biogenesis protein MshJ
MKKWWLRMEKRFGLLTRRERGVLLAGGLAVIFILGYSWFDSSLARQRVLAAQLSEVSAATAMSKAQAQSVTIQLSRDPDERARVRIAKLTEQVNSLEAQMQGVNRGLVPPQQMARILEKMLARDARVKLVKLKTLPVSNLIERKDGKQDAGQANVYKHGIEISLQGRYLDMLNYLDRLEALPWQMFWSEAKMDARDYPAVRITVTVFTLSLDRDWLVV